MTIEEIKERKLAVEYKIQALLNDMASDCKINITDIDLTVSKHSDNSTYVQRVTLRIEL